MSHITAGFLRNSPSERLVRLDYVFDGQLATSLFNFTNTTTVQIPGSNRTITMVDNTQVTASDGLTKKAEFRDYVISNYPLIGPGFLVEHAAVFAGFAKRDLVHERLASVRLLLSAPISSNISLCVMFLTCGLIKLQWSIMYQGSIPVTVFVDACDVVRGYDYFAPELRTRVVNLFFNTRVGRKGNESRNGLEQGRLGR